MSFDFTFIGFVVDEKTQSKNREERIRFDFFAFSFFFSIYIRDSSLSNYFDLLFR